MSAPESEVFGQRQPPTAASEYNTLAFIVQQLIGKLATCALVKVVNVYNAGGVAPVGLVDVQPMVHQMTGNRQPVPHATIFGVPYNRLQGGANAIILDPEVGDIGYAGFCSRDISAVKSAKAPANPGSFRQFDWADAVYLGQVLNGVPTQYVQFLPGGGGLNLTSPTQITLTAPNVSIVASQALQVTTPMATFSQDVTVTGILHALVDAIIAGISFILHPHGGVQSGSSNSGPPVP